MAKVLCYDIDGILTVESDTHHEDLAGTYIYRSPNFKARDQMLRAFNQGWTVVLFTGRRDWQRRLTEDWLASHGFHYHYLFCGKPYFSFIIDDRARSLDEIDKILDDEHATKTGGEAQPTQPNDPIQPTTSSAEPPVDFTSGEWSEIPLRYKVADPIYVRDEIEQKAFFRQKWMADVSRAVYECSIRQLDHCGIHIPGLWDRVRQLDVDQQRVMFLTEVTAWFRESVKKRIEETEVKRRDREGEIGRDKARKAQSSSPAESLARAGKAQKTQDGNDKAGEAQTGQSPHGELRCRPVEDARG